MNYDWLARSVAAVRAPDGGEAAGDDAAEDAPEQAPTEFGAFYEIDNLIINPAQSEGSRYLMVNVGFESHTDAVLTELEDKEVVVRDRVIKLLSEFTVPELSDIEQRPFLKDTILVSVNEVLQEGDVQRLYFTQYVLQ